MLEVTVKFPSSPDLFDICVWFLENGVTHSTLLLNVTGLEIPAVFNSTTTSSVALVGGGNTKAVDEILKVVSPALVNFITHLPAVEGITSCTLSNLSVELLLAAYTVMTFSFLQG